MSSSSNLLHCFPTLAIKGFFLMSESQLMLQLWGVPSPCATGLLHLPLQTRLPPWAAQHAACLFCKGTTSTSASNSVSPFFCSYVWLFLPCSSPYRIIFLPDFFFKFSKIYLYFILVAKALAALLISVASANLAGIVSLDGIRSEILYIEKLWNWKWTWHPICPAFHNPRGTGWSFSFNSLH